MAQGGGKPPSDWPAGGRIEYEKVTAVYRPGLPPVLRGLSFTIPVSARGETVPALPPCTALCLSLVERQVHRCVWFWLWDYMGGLPGIGMSNK